MARPMGGPVTGACDAELPVCAVCGREMTPRRRWASRGQTPRHCSRRCRGYRLGAADRALEAAIMALLEERPRGASICPAEAARRVRPGDWRSLMEPARMAARRLAARGAIVFLEKGRPVNPSTARGPVRLGAGRRGL
jgi:hypothetical protein